MIKYILIFLIFLASQAFVFAGTESEYGTLEEKYQTSINSGSIKAAGKFAKKLYSIKKSEINENRIIYTEGLLGKTEFAEKLLQGGVPYYRKKEVFSIAGSGLEQTGYFIETSRWYKQAIDEGFKSEEFSKGYLISNKKLSEDIRYIDMIFSFYDYGDNDLLLGGYNLNLNYNFGPYRQKFNLNFLIQTTNVNPRMNDSLGFVFYDNISQYEFFGQYNFIYSRYLSLYSGLKGGILVNDYIGGIAAVSAGSRLNLTDHFTGNLMLNYSALSYNFYDINEFWTGRDRKYDRFTGEMTSIQFSSDGYFNAFGFFAGGSVSIVKDQNSDYADDMLSSDRDFSQSELSEAVLNNETRYFYGISAGYDAEAYKIYAGWGEGDIFLVNSAEGRYLNTNDSRMEMNLSGGIILKKLFGDWVLGYTVSYSEFTSYTILTNSLTANYNWRNL